MPYNDEWYFFKINNDFKFLAGRLNSLNAKLNNTDCVTVSSISSGVPN